ncbi:lipopolysaccharide biosynthesis protein [Actinoplanes sp. NPDC051859]|uniref:lipopolysaccharide biosynthesis protein n=1 Tax=Actinoplanes sp. NPDC051859 TaxID=3363909 RepID=UPI003788DFBB
MLRRIQHLVTAKRGLEAAALFTVVSSVLTGILIARTLGPTGRGQIVVVATWGQALGWVCGLSVDKALIARHGAERRRLTSMPVSSGVLVMLAFGALAALVSGFAFTGLLADPSLCIALALVVLGTIACDARAAHLLVHESWGSYALLRFMQPAIYLLGCLIALSLAGPDSTAPIDLIAFALCISVCAPPVLIGGWSRVSLRLPRRAELKEVARFSGGYHVGSVLSFLASRIDLIVVSALFGLTEVGLYAVASSLGQLASIFGAANLMRGLTGRTRRSGIDVGGLLAAAAMTVAVAASAGWLITTVYGTEFAGAGEITRYLCIGGLLFYIRQGLNGQLAGLGRTWATAWANGVGVAAFAALAPFAHSLAQVAVFSSAAAAMSTAASYVLLRRSMPQETSPTELARQDSESTPPRTPVAANPPSR